MTDAERYAITLRKVMVDDQEVWRATVRELPDLAEFAETREEAIDLAVDAIESLKALAAEEGRSFPEPIDDEEEFSGRVTLRMSKSMHRDAAMRADTEGISLNSYVVECVALRTGAAVRVDSSNFQPDIYAEVLSNYASQRLTQTFITPGFASADVTALHLGATPDGTLQPRSDIQIKALIGSQFTMDASSGRVRRAGIVGGAHDRRRRA